MPTDQPQPAQIAPRRDRHGVPWCQATCPSYNAESKFFPPLCEALYEAHEEVSTVNAEIDSLCQPQARRDAAELTRLRTEHAQLTAAVEALEAMRKRAQAYLNPGYADTAITVAVRWILTGTTGDGEERG